MEPHSLHRLDEFLPHLARMQPQLLALLPAEERPSAGMSLDEWVCSLPQRRMTEISTEWVLESMKRLREESPLTNVILRGCLALSGEFNVIDAAAVATGEVPVPTDPRCEEVRAALQRAVRLGILIHLGPEDRYCIPFPLRLSYEGVDYLDPLERETIRLRIIHHFAAIARRAGEHQEPVQPRHWRHANMLTAWEFAVEMMEELMGLEGSAWYQEVDRLYGVPEMLTEPLVCFGRQLGRGILPRQSGSTIRLLSASVAAARNVPDLRVEAEAQELLGQYHMRRGEFEQAYSRYREIEELRRRALDHEGVVVAMSAAAIALREKGDVDHAIDRFVGAAGYARAHALLEAEIDTTNCAARLLLAQSRAREAIRLIDGTLESLKRGNRRYPAMAELLLNHGTALRATGMIDEARDWLTTALGLARSFLHRPAEAGCCMELSRLFASISNHDEAVKWLRRARQLYVELSDHGNLARCFIELHRLVGAEETTERGEMLLARALRSAERAGATDLVGDIEHERAIAALAAGDQAGALVHFQREIECRRKTGEARKLMEAYLRIGELFRGQDSPVAALASFLRAQAILRAHLPGRTSEDCERLVNEMRARLPEDQYELLTDEVTEELESGWLLGDRGE